MKRILALTLAVLMCMTVFVSCGKKDDLAKVKDEGKIVIGMTLFAPMNYYDGDELVGFETEFAKAVAEELGVEAVFTEIDWGTKEVELNSGNIDCIWNGMTITPERQEAMSISNPYMKNKQVLVTKAENAENYTTAEGLKNANIVAEQESAGEAIAQSNKLFKDAKYTAVDSMAKALLEVKSGVADACVVDYVTSIGMIGEGTDYEELVVVATEEFSPEEYGIAFRKDSNLTPEVNKAIEKLIADGTLEEIAEKYKLKDQLIVK